MSFSLFINFFKIGLFTFGGGYAMIAQIREEVVAKRNWLTEDELIEVIAIAESTPGPLAINLATFVGYKQRGFRGSLAATLGVCIPSVIIIFVISLFFDAFIANKYVAYAFVGIKCAVAFLILTTGISMMKTLDRKKIPVLVFVVTFIIMVIGELLSKSVNAILLILAGGIIGIFCTSFKRIRKEDADK